MDTPLKPVLSLLVVILACGIAVLILKFVYRPEPSYNGKTLTQWADQFGSNNWSASGAAGAREAKAAIQKVGTNSVPFLIELIRSTESPTRSRLRRIVPRSWHTRLHLQERTQQTRRTGAHALAALGPDAAAIALPDLIEIASRHPNEDARYVAVFAIRVLGEGAEPAIPFLIQCLTNSVNIIRDEAALALGYMHLQPDVTVPALTVYLKSVTGKGDWELRDAIASLGEFGTNATPALPILLLLLNHSDATVRSQVTNALGHIDPAGNWNRAAPRP
jgi:HEAT repeat protein